uniref:Replication factor C subunit 4 n=1 Tax=Gadus morhua TaxID=8049 RepID=A0A8C4ZZ16_GADMO
MQAFLKGTSVQSSKLQKDKGAPGTSTEKRVRPVPWVEKYRPKCVDEVAFQDEVVAVLKKSLEGADLPNLLFYDCQSFDERGIQVVRHKVKNFAQLTVAGTRTDGKRCPPFKIIILDEADSMTGPAQAALRRTMEKESRTTRFCLICNYVSRIIEPLTSRCSKFRFKPLANWIQEERLLEICSKENLKYSKEGIAALVKVSEGDLRKAITFLQSAARLVVDQEITEKTIVEIAGVVPSKMIDNLLQTCFKGTFEKVQIAIKDMVDEGYAATQILIQLHESIIEQDLNDKKKSAITEKMAVVDKCLADGADEYLQLLSLCSIIIEQSSTN